MEVEFIQITKWALEAREGINIAVTIFLPVLLLLFARLVYHGYKTRGRFYSKLNRTEKGFIGLMIMFSGIAGWSAITWGLLHTKGESGTYIDDVIPLTVCLFAVAIGALCAIRNFTPTRDATGWPVWGGHRLWVASLALYAIAITVNWGLL